jgi:hypothetical protein
MIKGEVFRISFIKIIVTLILCSTRLFNIYMATTIHLQNLYFKHKHP